MTMINEVLKMQSQDLMGLNRKVGSITGDSFSSVFSRMMPENVPGQLNSASSSLRSEFGSQFGTQFGTQVTSADDNLGFLPSSKSRFSNLISPLQLEAQSKLNSLMQLQSQTTVSPLLSRHSLSPFSENKTKPSLSEKDRSLLAANLFQNGYTLSFQARSERQLNAKLGAEQQLTKIHDELFQLAILHQDPSAADYIFKLWELGSKSSIAAKVLENKLLSIASSSTDQIETATSTLFSDLPTNTALEPDQFNEGITFFKDKLIKAARDFYSPKSRQTNDYITASSGRIISAYSASGDHHAV